MVDFDLSQTTGDSTLTKKITTASSYDLNGYVETVTDGREIITIYT